MANVISDGFSEKGSCVVVEKCIKCCANVLFTEDDLHNEECINYYSYSDFTRTVTKTFGMCPACGNKIKVMALPPIVCDRLPYLTRIEEPTKKAKKKFLGLF